MNDQLVRTVVFACIMFIAAYLILESCQKIGTLLPEAIEEIYSGRL